ncbi:MAG: PEP-CTERM sorting domain-containing protein [Verrucomicrobia bacterium]|nr:PEP-CTERM sorting domain-containing protein [Verrucomicrobiota bacterium]
MNIGANGSFVAAASNLGNINYWISNNAIRAENGTAGWAINVDTTSQSGKVVLTATIPEPSTLGTLSLGLILLGSARIMRRRA